MPFKSMQYTRRRFIAGLGASLTLPLSGCSQNGDVTPQHSRDDLEEEYAGVVQANDQNEFVPERVTIAAGESVVWFNNGDREHTVTAYEDEIPEDAEFFDAGDHESEQAARDDSGTGLLRKGDTYSYTFEVPGVYEYFCIPHERSEMVGTIVVEE